MASATWNCFILGQSKFSVHHTHAPEYSVTLFEGTRTYACLAITCHLHSWQNDRDRLRATAVTRGWNGHQNKSAQKVYPWDENSPAAHAGTRTRDLSTKSPSLYHLAIPTSAQTPRTHSPPPPPTHNTHTHTRTLARTRARWETPDEMRGTSVNGMNKQCPWCKSHFAAVVVNSYYMLIPYDTQDTD